MVNYHLNHLMKYHGKTLCIYNSSPRHKKKWRKIKFRSKTCYHDIYMKTKNVISITNLVKTTWLDIYPRPTEIT